MISDNDRKKADDERAVIAGRSKEAANFFLLEEQYHILHLTARILGRTVSMDDDEWSVALIAVGEALHSYAPDRGHFWNYAALVISSRLKDHFRKDSFSASEFSVSPDSFENEIPEDESAGITIEIQEKTAVVIDTRLRDEISAFEAELNSFGIGLFDLPKASPKASKTRLACAKLIKALFKPPPPLTDKLKASKNLPAAELIARTGIARKLIDKHRKYLIAAAIIADGDYPEMKEYLPVETNNEVNS